MSEEQILKSIDLLKNQIRLTESQNLKKKYLNDIVVLLGYLSQTYGIELDPEVTLNDALYADYVYNFERDLFIEEGELLSINPITEVLANQTLETYEKSKFYPYTIPENRGVDSNYYNELILNFVSSLGDNVYKKYVDLFKEGVLVMPMGPKYAGGCWDFPAMDKQSICVGTLGFDLYPVLAHELGHAVHFDALNKIGRRRLSASVFVESLSTIYELLFLDYLEKNNIDINNRLRDFYYTFLKMCIKVKTYLRIHELDEIDLNEVKIDTDSEIIKSYYETMLDGEVELDFFEDSSYFYGALAALSILDKTNDPKEAANEMLQFLLKSEVKNYMECLKDLGIDEKIPNGLEKNLKRIR